MSTAKRSKKFRVGVVLAIGLLALLVLGAMLRSERVLGLKEPLQFDDFFFTALDVREAKTLGDGELKRAATEGTFLVVTFQIENRAKRVNYQFRDNVVLVDDQGREYPVSIAGEAVLRSERGSPSPCSGPIPAGSTCVTELVFDVPEGVKNLCLRLTFGPIGDALEELFFGRSSIRIR